MLRLFHKNMLGVMLAGAIMLLGTAGCSTSEKVTTSNEYVWEVQLVLCGDCAGTPEQHSEEQIQVLADSVLSELGPEAQFDHISESDMFIHATDELKQRITTNAPRHVEAIYYHSLLDNDAIVTPDNDTELYACVNDADCVAVPDGCCSCSNGGSNTAVNTTFQNYWETTTTTSCAVVSCIAAISNDPSCSATPVCIDNVCHLAPTQ